MEHGVLTIIEGGAVGADTFAGEWTCIQRSCQLVTEYANWENMADPPDRSAIRRCSTITRPNLVVAFPGGRGTADMVLKARRAGIEVIQIPVTAGTIQHMTPDRCNSPGFPPSKNELPRKRKPNFCGVKAPLRLAGVWGRADCTIACEPDEFVSKGPGRRGA